MKRCSYCGRENADDTSCCRECGTEFERQDELPFVESATVPREEKPEARLPPDEFKDVERHMETLDDHALLRLVAIEQGDYRSEALEIADAELRRRGMTLPTKEEYWTKFPSERIGPDGFCAGCHAATTDDSPGVVGVVHLVGTRLIGHDDVCPACGAVLQRKWVCVGLPLIPLSKYRVIYVEGNPLFSRFVARKLRNKRG